MLKLSSLFIIKLSLSAFLVNIVLPLTYIINDRLLGFEKTGSNQLSFFTLSVIFNLVIIPGYSLILVSQNLNWLIMMPVSRLRLLFLSAWLRGWSFILGIALLVTTQFLMERFYYSNFSSYQAQSFYNLASMFFQLGWLGDIDWSYSSYALVFTLICLFLSSFVLNFDLDSRTYRFTTMPFLFLLKGKIRAIIGLIFIILFFGFISLSRANIFILFSLSLPFFMMISANIFVLGRNALLWIKACALLIIGVHITFISLAREELKRNNISLERSISNFEYLELYAANPVRLAHRILDKMIESKKINTSFIRDNFDELDIAVLHDLLSYSLSTSDLDNLSKFIPATKIDPFFFDPIESIKNKSSSEASLATIHFYNTNSFTLDHVYEILNLLSRKFPSSLYSYYEILSQRRYHAQEIYSFLEHEDKAIVKFGLILLRYYPQIEIGPEELMALIERDPLLIEDTYKTVIVRTGEYIDINRLLPTLRNLNLNREERCPATSQDLFRLVGDKGSYLTYTICLRTYLGGVIRPSIEQMEVIENPFFGNHLEMTKKLVP